MKDRNFRQLLEAKWSSGNFVCVGLDSDYKEIPDSARRAQLVNTVFTFNSALVDATKDVVCAYKPNIAFYEAYGIDGWLALYETLRYIHTSAPDVPVILAANRADTAYANAGYVQGVFESLQVDAITVHPYLGADALQPFLARADKGIFVLCRTSDPGAREFQDLSVNGEPLYCFVARRVARYWNRNGNCAVVVSATYPDELREVRGIVGDMPILITEIGAQGGDVERTVSAGKDSRGQGMIINSSRDIIFASKGADFAEAARRETLKLRDMINQFRETGEKL